MAIKIPKKRGRKSKVELAAIAAAKPRVRTDAEIKKDLLERFDLLSRLTKGAIHKNIRAMVVTGAPGVGKSYTVENIIQNTPNLKYEIVGGALSAINLYTLGYRNRRAGNVIVLDDADGIFNDEDAVNILKALCDTSAQRRVSYLKDANKLKEEDVPQTYEFNGAMIFISNLDFQTFVDQGKNKFAMHFEALMSRSLYLDLRLHTRRELGVWVDHIATAGRIFDREDVPEQHRPKILNFLEIHREELRELSIRTLTKLCGLAKDNPVRWEVDARILLTRTK